MKAKAVAETWATPKPWAFVNKKRYGDIESYRKAGAWLRWCRTVADWGGGGGAFKDHLPPGVEYFNVDGTKQNGVDIVTDLIRYTGRSEGILLRHVVDNTPEPWSVLSNALRAFEKRLVVVTYTPHVPTSRVAEYQHGWPVWHLNHDELMRAMGDCLVRSETTILGNERLYYAERR